MRDFSALSLLVSFALSFTACMGSDDTVGRNLGIGAACGASGDCASNLECEVEHGVASCQPHGGRGEGGASSDAGATASRVLACRVHADCAMGEECEDEHGLRVCRPHHSGASPDAGSASPDAGSASPDAGSASPTTGCAVDTDCAAGLECEVEHGVGICQPHRGGRADDAGSTPVDAGSTPVDAGSAPVDAGSAPADAPAGRGVGGACTVDLDCAAGLECEVEHGVGTCEPHGRR